MNNELTVVEELLNGNARPLPAQAGQADAAQMNTGNATQNGMPQAAGAMPAQGGQQYYKSQKEVDAAFARRLEAERRKWSRQSAMPNGAAPALNLPPQVPQTAAQATMAGISGPDLAVLMNGKGQSAVPPQAALPGSGEPDASAAPQAGQALPQDAAAGANPDLARTAMRLLAEEADIKQVFPQFDLESFLSMGEGVRDALLAGNSLWSVFAGVYGEVLKRQAEDATVERIRSRNSSVPDVLRHGGAAGSVGPDYASMPSEQFNKLRKAYEAEMRKGKKVKP